MFDLHLLSSLLFETMGNQQKVRETIITIFNEYPCSSYKTISRQVGVSRNTVSRVIKKYKELLTIDRKPGCGRKKVFVDKADKIKRIFSKNPNIS